MGFESTRDLVGKKIEAKARPARVTPKNVLKKNRKELRFRTSTLCDFGVLKALYLRPLIAIFGVNTLFVLRVTTVVGWLKLALSGKSSLEEPMVSL